MNLQETIDAMKLWQKEYEVLKKKYEALQKSNTALACNNKLLIIKNKELRENNDWLYAMLKVDRDHDMGLLIDKMKHEFLEAVREYDSGIIKEKIVRGLEEVLYGDNLKTKEKKKDCSVCEGHIGECPYGVKPKCDKSILKTRRVYDDER